MAPDLRRRARTPRTPGKDCPSSFAFLVTDEEGRRNAADARSSVAPADASTMSLATSSDVQGWFNLAMKSNVNVEPGTVQRAKAAVPI